MNFVPMTVGETLDLLSFFAFKCNGTTILAEIHREVMSNVPHYFCLWSDCSSMYQFLSEVNKIVSPKAIGSCTEPRFTFCGGNLKFDWSSVRRQLLSLLSELRRACTVSSSKLTMRKEVSRVIDTLMKARNKKKDLLFPGAGAMGCNHFVHGAALIGLLPLGAYNHAEIRSSQLGPGLIINACTGRNKSLSPAECTDVLYTLHSSFAAIWNNMPSVNFFENRLCYLSRCYKESIKSLKKGETYDVDIIKDDKKRKQSATKNVYYMDERRGRIQNMFMVRTSGSRSSPNKPVLMMKDAFSWSLGDQANIPLTNWLCDKNDQGLLRWDWDNCNLCIESTLFISKKIFDLYSLKE